MSVGGPEDSSAAGRRVPEPEPAPGWRAAVDCVHADADAGLRLQLEDNGSLATARGPSGKTLLHEAAEVDALGCARALLDAGAPLEWAASWGHTPFVWAAAMGSARVAALLLERGASGLNLWTAAGIGDLTTVERSFDAHGPIAGSEQPRLEEADARQWPADTAYRRGDVVSDALYTAARNGHLAIVRLLHERGGTVNATGFFGASALHWAALNGHAHVVDWLVDAGAALLRRDPAFDATPADWAEEGGHPALAHRLRAAAR